MWNLPLSNGGEATPLTEVNGNVVEYEWFPDGKKLVLTVQEVSEEKDPNSDVMVIIRLRYKSDGVREFINTRKHIYLIDLETKETTKITEGDFDFYGPKFSATENCYIF